jgi:pyruvate kinase
MALSWGVRPMEVDTYATTDELVWHAVEQVVHHGIVHSGQTVLVLAGAPDRPSGASTDVLRIVRVS